VSAILAAKLRLTVLAADIMYRQYALPRRGEREKNHTKKGTNILYKKRTLHRPKAPWPINLDSMTHKFSPYLKEKEEGKGKKTVQRLAQPKGGVKKKEES
jgi:hypothetical protein